MEPSRNRILAFGLDAIVAEVYKAASWFDNKECIVLDYSKTSLVAEHVRDEIRQIGPGHLFRPGVLGKTQDHSLCAAISCLMTILSNPDRPLPKANTGSALLNWLANASTALVHLGAGFDPFFRPLSTRSFAIHLTRLATALINAGRPNEGLKHCGGKAADR